VNINDYVASNKKIEVLIEEYDYVLSGHNDPWVKSEVIRRAGEAFEAIASGAADYSDDGDLRRYFFDGFDILIREEIIAEMNL
jgi:hypothetical protein